MTPEQRAEALPPLPEPDVYLIVREDGSYTESRGDKGTPYFDADQMAAYAAAALAAQQAQAEPVAAVAWVSEFFKKHGFYPSPAQAYAAGLLTAPPAVRAPLTEAQINQIRARPECWEHVGQRIEFRHLPFARAIEAAHGITQEHRR